MKDSTCENNSEKKVNKWKKHIPLYIVEGVVLIAVVVGLIGIIYATKMNKVNLDESKIEVNEQNVPEENVNEDVLPEIQGGEVVTQVQISEEEKEAKEKAAKELYGKYDGKLAIAFFGVDSRDQDLGAGTRSDSIMICLIDMDTHEAKLVSIYRDTYLNLGNDKYNKCNSAYAIGGPERAISMININTDLFISDYVTVGFRGLIDAIDALGGIPIEVTEEEIFHLNNYQMTMAEELGVSYTPVVFPGMQMLNGLQATAYCRIRYTSGYDFKRTERQRNVLTAMLEKTGSVSLPTLTAALTKVFPNVATSLSLDDLVSLMSLASDYTVTVSEGFPFKGMVTTGTIGDKGSCVVPDDLYGNVIKLHEVLYGEENYKPSKAVQKYSAKIEQDTADYL